MHKCLIKSSTATLSLSNVGFANSMSSLIYSHGKKINNRGDCLRAVECFSCSGRFFLNTPIAEVTLMHKILLLSQLLQKSIYFHVHWWKACLKIQTAGLGISISRNSNNLADS